MASNVQADICSRPFLHCRWTTKGAQSGYNDQDVLVEPNCVFLQSKPVLAFKSVANRRRGIIRSSRDYRASNRVKASTINSIASDMRPLIKKSRKDQA